MATNPRIPSNPPRTGNKRPEIVPPLAKKKWPGAGPGVAFGIIVAAALIAAIVYYMPRAPHKSPAPTNSQSPVQPTPNELQFSNLHITNGPAAGEVTLNGTVMNAGNRPILNATVQLNFTGADGRVVGSVTEPLQGMVEQGGVLQPESWGTHPFQPNQTRVFRITLNNVPAGWNHAMPSMTVLTVGAEGSR
jgi:hypothetical protein